MIGVTLGGETATTLVTLVFSGTDPASPTRTGERGYVYEISLDKDRKLLRVAFKGLWDIQTLDRYEAEREAVVRGSGWRSGEYDYLLDLRGHPVQPRDVAAKGDEYYRTYQPRPRKLALIVSSALARMQVTRVVKGMQEQLFANEEAALAWLAEE